MNPDYLLSLSTIKSYKEFSDKLIFYIDDELLELSFLSSSITRVRISQGQKFIEAPSVACIKNDWTHSSYKVSETADRYLIKTEELEVHLTKNNFQISIKRNNGSSILEPYKDTPFYQYQNNFFTTTRKCLPHEHIYGLGEKTGSLDRHGRSFVMKNKDVLAPDPDKKIEDLIAEKDEDPLSTSFDPYYMSIGFYYRMHPNNLAAAGYFIDNPFPAKYSFDNQKNTSHITTTYSGGQYCEYFFSDPLIKNILADYTKLTGTISLPPLWSLGYHQCRWKKYNEVELLELATKQRESGSPCDVLWLDIDYMDEYRVFTWNEELFPDRQTLFKKLKEMGFRVITIVDPGVKYDQEYKVFQEARDNDLLCKCENGQIYIGQVWPGKTAFPDFSNKPCRDWWGKKNAEHIKEGIAGIWNDMNEPATGSISPEAMRFSGEDDGNHPHDRFHNEYGTLMAMSTIEGLKADNPDQRTFVLSRAGSPGIQRYAANWMGDNASRWDHLKMSLPMAMGLGLSGQPFVGADIGGFVEATNPELFIRWMQCGVFYPFCRNHNDHPADQYVWSFGTDVQEICKKFIELRYRLLPYIYTQFVKSHKTGSTILSPLVYDYQDDPAVREIDDQFLFGDDILVCPIMEPAVNSRTIYLPKGEWYDMNNHESITGPKWLNYDCKLDQIPWFLKAGKVIPMLKTAPQSTMNLKPEEIVLMLATPSQDGEYTSELYEDDGLTEAFHKDKFIHTQFSLKVSDNNICLSVTVSGKGYTGFSRKEFLVEVLKSPKSPDKYIAIENSGTSFGLDIKKTTRS
ncbi:MAG: glycoside hydrolase family 31 protein [Lentisphaeraceae bacterium]|nr:glycoside hydrolase family 31 protein [Lentisphaeraceae bacterium]